MRLIFALLAMAAVPCSMTTNVHAEVVELESTVKSIDKDARTISVVRKTVKGVKTLELEVAKKAGDLSEVEEGDTVSFSYDPRLEVVTKISEERAGNDKVESKADKSLKGVTEFKDGKYRVEFDSGNGWGVLFEIKGDTLLVHGDINPKQPNKMVLWDYPVPCPYIIKNDVLRAQSMMEPDSTSQQVLFWDLKKGNAVYTVLKMNDKAFRGAGRVTPEEWKSKRQ